MRERDYSYLVTNPIPKEDGRPFWLRLLLSLRLSISPCSKKTSSEDKKGVKFKVSGGADF